MRKEKAGEETTRPGADRSSSEELEAAADKLAEVGAQAKAEDLLSTEEREGHDKDVLENMVARQGVDGVISMLRDVCHLKAKRLQAKRKDKAAAQMFKTVARKLDEFIGWYYNCKKRKQPKYGTTS